MRNNIVVIIVTFFLSSAQATVWYVHPDSALNIIQAGLDSCATDDTVLVGPGIYYENVIWPHIHGIDLFSEYGTDSTMIDGNKVGTVIEIMSGVDTTTIIREFTIRNGDGTCGGGIYCDSGSSPVIIGNTIIGNKSTGGGGIGCWRSSPIIAGNLFRDDTTYISGGAIYCSHNSAPAIIGNTICYCKHMLSGHGVGGIKTYDSSPNIADNTISHCNGTGIMCTGNSSPTITNNNIYDNDYSGIWCLNSSPTIRGNIITDNYDVYDGGGIACSLSSRPIIDSCTISNNRGDGVYSGAASSPTIHYCNITGNRDFGVRNVDDTVIVDARYNWWGDSTGHYHPDSNPGGLGDSVSDYVDFIPWLYWPGVEEKPSVNPIVKRNTIGSTIFAGPLQLPEGKNCKVFDIMGRVVMPDKIKPGIYFIEVDGKIKQKVIKLK
jgi:parallel beta-helix repeat protein